MLRDFSVARAHGGGASWGPGPGPPPTLRSLRNVYVLCCTRLEKGKDDAWSDVNTCVVLAKLQCISFFNFLLFIHF